MSLRDYVFHEEPGITLYCGDARVIVPEIEADVVLADPPYNYGKEYGQHDDGMAVDAYDGWISEWWSVLPTHRRIVFPGVGRMWLWADRKPKAVACWYKPGNPAGGGPFQWCEWEPILLWGVNFSGSDVFRAPVLAGWNAQKGLDAHPCPKPLPLYEQIIGRLRTKGVILDPFCGSGTTLEAAKNAGRVAIGIEIEPRYCEIAVKRLRQEVLPLTDPPAATLDAARAGSQNA